MRNWRTVLIAVGVLGLGLGAFVLVTDQNPIQIVGVGIWIIGAIIVHDLLIAPIVVGADLLMRRYGRRIPYIVLAVVQGAVIVGSILTLVIVPEIYAKTLGTANPTVLPFNYGLQLLLLWVAIAVVTAALCVASVAFIRRTKVRESRVHD